MSSTYLERLRQRYDATRAGIVAISEQARAENRDATDDEMTQVRADGAELQRLADQITEMQAEENRAASVAATAAAVGAGGGPVSAGAPGPDGLGGPGTPAAVAAPLLMPSPAQVEQLCRAAQGGEKTRVTIDQSREARTQARAAVTTSDTGGVTAELAARPREPRRLATAARLAVVEVAGTSSVEWPVFGAGEAEVTEEGEVKAEYSAISTEDVRPQVIALWTDYSRQATLSRPSFEARLRIKHAALLAKQEDLLLVRRVLATDGVPTIAPTSGTAADALLAGAAAVYDGDSGAAPDLAVVNGADVPRIFGGSTGRNGETPDPALDLRIYGMSLYVSSAVAPGHPIVGAWGASASYLLGMAPTVLIDPYSGAKRNLITLLSELACELGVEEPTGFAKVTLPAP